MKNIENVSQKIDLSKFIEAVQRGEYARDPLIALGFDGKTVHLVTSAPLSDVATDVETIKQWQAERGHSYLGAASFNGTAIGFLPDRSLLMLPSAPAFNAAVVRFLATRMKAQGLNVIEESFELPKEHGELAMVVGSWMNGEIVGLKSMECDGRKMEHCVLLDRTIGAIVSEGRNVYYVPATIQQMLETDTKRWTKVGTAEKPIVYLSRPVNGKIAATLKGEVSHQLIANLDRLTPDNPKVAKIGSEMKGNGIFVGTLSGKKNMLALFTKTDDGRRTTIIVGAKNTKAPHIARELVASAA